MAVSRGFCDDGLTDCSEAGHRVRDPIPAVSCGVPAGEGDDFPGYITVAMRPHVSLGAVVTADGGRRGHQRAGKPGMDSALWLRAVRLLGRRRNVWSIGSE